MTQKIDIKKSSILNLDKKKFIKNEIFEEKKIFNDNHNDINSKTEKQKNNKIDNSFEDEKQEKYEDNSKYKNKSNTKKKEILKSYNTKGIKFSYYDSKN